MILDIMFPRVCVGCQTEWSYLCRSCKKQLHPHPEICPLTHKTSPWYIVRQDLLKLENPLDGCIVLFRFEPLIKKLILSLKYKHRYDIGNFLGTKLALALQSHETLYPLLTNKKLIITYVPSHRIRHHITKGYNQSKTLATILCKELSDTIPTTLKQVCKKTKHTHSQVGMTKIERQNNLSDAFNVTTTIEDWSTIVIIDDVLTSGATMIEIAKTIKKNHPNCKVWWLCVARNG